MRGGSSSSTRAICSIAELSLVDVQRAESWLHQFPQHQTRRIAARRRRREPAAASAYGAHRASGDSSRSRAIAASPAAACRRARSIPHPREAVNLCLSEEAVRPLARRTRRCAVQHADPAMSGDHQVRRHPAAGRRSGRGAPTRTWCGPDRVRAARSAVRRRTGPAPRRNCRCSRRSRQPGGTAVEPSRSSSSLRRALAVRSFGVRHGAGPTWGSARLCGRSPGRRGARRSAWPGCWTSRRDHRGCAVPV